MGFPGGAEVKASACNVGDLGLIPGSGRSPGEGNGNPLQYSCLENPWTEELGGLESTGRKELDTTERLHFHLVFLGVLNLGSPGALWTSYIIINISCMHILSVWEKLIFLIRF